MQLYGKSRREVLSFLKEVPPPFTLVCCRHPTADLEPESESEHEPVLRTGLGPEPLGRSQPSVEEVRNTLSISTLFYPIMCVKSPHSISVLVFNALKDLRRCDEYKACGVCSDGADAVVDAQQTERERDGAAAGSETHT